VAGSKREFERADVVSVHYVRSERSKGIVSTTELDLMWPWVMLDDSSRGPLVVEKALYDALEKGRIRGAALDDFWIEPLPGDSRWRTTRWGEGGRGEVVMTPHTGFVSWETMENWWVQTRTNLERWSAGKEVLDRLW